MKKLVQFILILTLIGLNANAQVQKCGTMENLEKMQKKHPEVKQNMQEIEKFTQEWIKNNPNSLYATSPRTYPIMTYIQKVEIQ